MTIQTPAVAETQFVIHPATRLGHVYLTVADLGRQIAFYQDVLGYRLHWREGTLAGLGAGLGAGNEDLLRLTELKDARRLRRNTGLYHQAVLVPTRWELAQLLKRIAETRTAIQGMVNHYTHLAIYLPDAEGNGIELAWDFPRQHWPKFDQLLSMGNGPLEPEELFAELERDPSPWNGLDPSSRIGHVHLHVADLDAAEHFYHDVLGFEPTFSGKQFGAVFVAAGGYHHHIGLNVWQGVGAPPPPPDARGLRHFTIVLPDKAELQRVVERVQRAGIATEQTEQGILVRDPSQNGVLLT